MSFIALVAAESLRPMAILARQIRRRGRDGVPHSPPPSFYLFSSDRDVRPGYPLWATDGRQSVAQEPGRRARVQESSGQARRLQQVQQRENRCIRGKRIGGVLWQLELLRRASTRHAHLASAAADLLLRPAGYSSRPLPVSPFPSNTYRALIVSRSAQAPLRDVARDDPEVQPRSRGGPEED